MAKRQPPQRDIAPVAARYRVHYRKVGQMRFASARDFQRALERAIRRAGVPIASTAGFSPHPRISYTNAVATGVSSLAEYCELALTERVDPERLGEALHEGLPAGFDVVEVLEVASDDLVGQLQASLWEFAFPGTDEDQLAAAVRDLLALPTYGVHRVTKAGGASVDVRAALLDAQVSSTFGAAAEAGPCAILQVVVRHVTPSVRPPDVLTALAEVAGLQQSQTPRICRLAQGPLLGDGPALGDPLDRDRRVASRA